MAQRLGCATSRRAGQDEVDGRCQTDLPARVHHQRADPRLGAQRTCDDLTSNAEEAGGAPTVIGPVTLSDQWAVRDAYRGHRKFRAQVQSQSSSARMVTPCAVDEQHVRTTRQSAGRLLHQPTSPEGEETREVRRSCHARNDPLVHHLVASQHDCGSPRRVAGSPGTGSPTREAHPASARADPAVRRSPVPRGDGRQLFLIRDQRLHVGGPHASMVARDDPYLTRGCPRGGRPDTRVVCVRDPAGALRPDRSRRRESAGWPTRTPSGFLTDSRK